MTTLSRRGGRSHRSSTRIPAHFGVLGAQREANQISDRGAATAAVGKARHAVGRREALLLAGSRNRGPDVATNDETSAAQRVARLTDHELERKQLRFGAQLGQTTLSARRDRLPEQRREASRRRVRPLSAGWRERHE